MKRLITLVLCITALCISPAQAQKKVKNSGKIVTETFDLQDFTGISTSSGIDVYLTQSPTFEVKVKTDRNIQEYVQLKVKNGVLNISYKNNSKIKGTETVVYVSMPEIKYLSASSGADIKARGILTGDKIELSASSAGDIKLILDYDNVKATASSGADIELKGKADKCIISASSGSDIEAENLVCREVKVSASSGSDVDVRVTEKISGDASSGADITYYGEPDHVDVKKSSGGSVKHKR